MNTSENTDLLDAAMAKAQGQMTGAKKDSINPHFRNNYSSLASVIDAAREALSSNGIAVYQSLGNYVENTLQVTTRLAHAGQWIQDTQTVPIAAKAITPQVLMSASTYGRRYGLMAMLCLAPIEDTGDDDGNAASSASQPAQATPVPLTDSQVATLRALLGELPGEVTVNFLRALNVEDVEAVPAARYDWACTALRKKIAEAGATA